MSRVVLVKTCQKFLDRRAACESTWAKELRHAGVRAYFVQGGYCEAGISGDLIQTATGDAYDDNSFKVRDAIRMLLAAERFEHLFVCDDNTFVHWQRWLDFKPRSDLVGLVAPPTIPWIHGGAGWYMSRRACELFIAGIKRRCSWDDRLASEILSRHGIEIDNHPELFAQWDERVSANNQLITCHNVEPDEMRLLFQSTHALSNLDNLLR